jgi:hypothetical protein
MLTTNQNGVVAETAVIHAAVKLGIGVWIPVLGHERYDLILDVASRLVRVQCKTAVHLRPSLQDDRKSRSASGQRETTSWPESVGRATMSSGLHWRRNLGP